MVLNVNYEEEILKILRTLDDRKKQEVLNYLRIIDSPKGELGKNLIEDSRNLNFDAVSLKEMEDAINEDCEIVEDFRDINLDD